MWQFTLLTGIFFVRISFGQAPSTTSDLHQYGIRTDHDSLCRALQDPRPRVRVLAAIDLQQQKDQSALPALRAALNEETNESTKINLATSIMRLGDDQGTRSLRDVCAKTTDNSNLVLAATVLASLKGDYSCAPYILRLLTLDDVTYRESALLYLSHVPSSQKGLAAFGPPLLSSALMDTDPYNRQLATKALMTLGDKASQLVYAQQQRKAK